MYNGQMNLVTLWMVGVSKVFGGMSFPLSWRKPCNVQILLWLHWKSRFRPSLSSVNNVYYGYMRMSGLKFIHCQEISTCMSRDSLWVCLVWGYHWLSINDCTSYKWNMPTLIPASVMFANQFQLRDYQWLVWNSIRFNF